MKSNHEFSLAEEQKDDHEQQVIARYNKRDEKSDGKRASRLRRALSRVLDKIARDRKDPTSDEYVR